MEENPQMEEKHFGKINYCIKKIQEIQHFFGIS